MKNIFTFFKVLLVLLVVVSCSEDGEGNDSTGRGKMVVYKNQTGDASADALQAQYTGAGNDYKVNFYGKFDAANDPLSTNTITYQKQHSDTIVNFVLDPATKRLASSFITVNGAKSPIVAKYDYFDDAPNAVSVSYYNYNWLNNSSELIMSARLDENQNVNGRMALQRSSNSGLDWLTGITVGIAVAETVAYYQGGATLVSIVGTGAAAILASTTAVAIITGVAVGVVISVISAVLNPAHASDLEPQDQNYPQNTDPNNPAVPDPTQYLPVPLCIDTTMTFSASMDSEGTIMIWGVNGGSGNYNYLVNSIYQQGEIFSNNYPDGEYLVAVKDGNGCVSAKKVALSRNISTQPQWYKGTYTLTDCESCCGAQMGQSGDVYILRVGDWAVSYSKSILTTVPSIYQSALLSENVLTFAGGPNFTVGYLSFTEGSNINTSEQFGLGRTNNTVVCQGGPSGFELYMVDVHLDYFGAAPPEELTPLNLEIMNAFASGQGYQGHGYYYQE